MRENYFPSFKEAMADPDEIVDEVAIDRALAGDVKVLDQLTPREREAMLRRIASWYDTPKWELVDMPREEIENHSGYMPTRRRVAPLLKLSELWDMDYHYLRNKVQQRLRNRFHAAKAKSRTGSGALRD